MDSKGLTITTFLIAAIAVVALSIAGVLIYSYNDGTIIPDDTNFTEPNNTGTPTDFIDSPQNQTRLVCVNRQCRAVAGVGPNLNGCTTLNAACGGAGSGGGGSGGSGGSGSGSSSSGTGSSNQAPIAIFEAIPSSGSAPLIVVFNATNSTDSDGSIVSYFWNFGDATNATGMIVNHTYPNPGVYNITLTVTDDDGATDSDNSTINVGDTLDTTPPQYSNIVALPASPAFYSPGRLYTFSSIWTDDTSVHHVELVFNGVVYSALNTGSLYTAQVPNLAVGTYSYFFRGYDAVNNMNQTTPFTYSVVRNTTTLGFTVVPSNTVQQGTQTNVTGIGCPAGITCTLLRNGASVSNPNIATLAVGSYIYNYSMSGNANYTSTSTVTMVTVTSLPTVLLTVTKNAVNGGQGTVTSNPSGINCGSDCTESYTQGTPVTLNAAASTGSTFTGWSGGGCSGTGSCVVTMNSAQTVTATFSLDLPSPPNTLTATTVSSSALDLTWIDTSNNEAGFTLERSLTSNFATITSISLPAVSGTNTQGNYQDSSGLSPNTQYFYRIKATNAAGTSPESNVAAAITLPNPPSTPTNVRALTQSTSQIDISWNAASGASSYRVYVDTNPNGPFLQFITVLSGTSTQHTGLSPGTTHYYKVAAVNQGGQSSFSATINNSTIPNAPTGASVTGTTTSSVSLNWNSATGASSYRIYRSLTSGGTYTSVGTSSTASFTDTNGLTAGTIYFYRISASNQGGESTQSSTVNGTTQSNQFTLTVVRSGTGSGTVTSNPSGINCGTDCTESYTQGTPVTLNAVPDGSSTFAGWSGGGCSGTGACVVTMSQANTVTATFTLNPPQQFTLTVTKAGSGTGTVTSNPSGINCGSTCSALYNQNTQVTLSPSATGGSTFAGWSGGCTGTGSCIVTMSSNQAVTATFNPPAPATPTNIQVLTQSTSQIDVSWNAVSGATAYRVYPASNVNGPFSTFIFVSSGTSTPITGYNPGTTQFYKVSAVNPGGESPLSATFTNTTITSAPSGLTVTGTTTSSVSLSWSTTTGATSYRIYRSLSVGGSYSLVGTSATTSFTDSTGLNSNTQYFYRVSGVNQGGESAQSASTSGTTQANSFTLTVTKQSTNGGQGTVTSNPSGINCGSTCSASFTQGTPVTLTPSPSVGSTFTGWSGACSGTGSCQVTMNSAQTVTATFALAAPSPPTGMIATAISQTRIDVNWTDTSTNEANFILERATNNAFTTGLQTFTPAANVQSFSDTTLTANTQYFYRVRATNAAGTSANSNTASATTLANNFILTVTKLGTGSGTVTSNPSGINCGSTCSANYAPGTPVTLTATPSSSTLSPLLQIQGRRIVDRCGAPVTIRGFEQQQNPVGTGIGAPPVSGSWNYIVDDMVARGGNDIRILPDGVSTAQLESMINRSVQQGFIVHTHASYQWYLDNNLKTMLDRYKGFMILDVFGEPAYDNRAQWQTETMQALNAVRAFGYDQPLMFMANNYGRDLPSVLQYGQTLQNADPLHRVVMGWQSYWGQSNWYQNQYGMNMQQAFQNVSNAAFPIIVGLTADADSPSDPINYQQQLSLAHQLGIDTFWWDYYNVLPADINDLVTYSGSQFQLTSLGQAVLVTDPNSLANRPVARACTSGASSSTFAGWGGACSGTGTCQVTMSQSQSVSATFNAGASDTIPPATTLITPSDGSTVSTTPQTFSAQTSDGVQLKNATFTLWNGNTIVTQSFQTLSGTSATATFSNIALPSQVLYRWNVRSCDTSHNCAWAPANFTVTYSTAPSSQPTISFTGATPANGATQTSTSVTVATTSSDTDQYYTMLDFNRDLALWMRMDDVVSGNPQDLSTYANHGVRNGNAVQNLSGKFGRSFSFDGNGDFINVASPTGLNFGGSSFTISLWVHPTVGSTTAWPTLLEYDRFGTNWFGMWKTDTNHFHFRVGAVGTDFVSTVSNNQWYHVVGVFNASTNTVTLYQNGVQDRTLVVAPGTLAPTQSALRIASSADASGEYYSGGLDEIMIFKRALSATEVSSLFNAQSQPSVSRTFTNLPFAAYTYQAHAVDVQGQRGDTEVRDLTIQLGPDAIAPGITLTSPSNGATIGTSPATFSATATDNQALKNATITVMRGATLVAQTTQTISGTSAPVTFSNIALPVAGAHTWNVRVCDLSHNCATSSDFGFSFTPPVCGNGILEAGEQCEGSNLNGQTCQSQGYSGGTLSCTASCTFNTNQCTGTSGWTIFTPSSTSQIVYLSTSGSDSADCVYTAAEVGGDVFNPTVAITPCQSLSNGYGRLRAGQDDFLLLKRGDTWTTPGTAITLNKDGFSPSRKQVVGSWSPASAPNPNRPKIQMSPPVSGAALIGSGGVRYVAVTDLFLYMNTGESTPQGRSSGVDVCDNTFTSDLHFENLRIERFGHGISISSWCSNANGAGLSSLVTNVLVRRNVIADSFNALAPSPCASQAAYYSFGIYLTGKNVIFEENMLAHNGMSGSLNGYPQSTCHNHNYYFKDGAGEQENLTVRNNLIIRGMDGGKSGSTNGGDYINNTFIKQAVGIFACCDPGQRFIGNVFIDGLDYGPSLPRGHGFWIDEMANSLVKDNILAHQRTATGASGNAGALYLRGTPSGSTFTGNIIYNWCMPTGNTGFGIRADAGGYTSATVFSNNQIQQACPTGYTASVYGAGNTAALSGATFTNNTYWSHGAFMSGGPGYSYAQWISNGRESESSGTRYSRLNYTDPNRDAATYMNSLFGTNHAFGSEAGLKAFDDRMRNQSKWSWDTRFTTKEFNQYIRDGFRVTSCPGCDSPESPQPPELAIAASPENENPFTQVRKTVRRILHIEVATTAAPRLEGEPRDVSIVGHVISASEVKLSDQKLLLGVIGLLVVAIALVVVVMGKHSSRFR